MLPAAPEPLEPVELLYVEGVVEPEVEPPVLDLVDDEPAPLEGVELDCEPELPELPERVDELPDWPVELLEGVEELLDGVLELLEGVDDVEL